MAKWGHIFSRQDVPKNVIKKCLFCKGLIKYFIPHVKVRGVRMTCIHKEKCFHPPDDSFVTKYYLCNLRLIHIH